MVANALSHLSNEAVLWEGKPARPVIWPALTTLLLVLALASALFNDLNLEVFFSILFFISLGTTFFIALRFRSTHYYVTNQRVVTEWWGQGHKELPLENLTEVHAKTGGVNRRPGSRPCNILQHKW